MPVTILSSRGDVASSSSTSSGKVTFETQAAPFGIEWAPSSPIDVDIVIFDPPYLCEMPTTAAGHLYASTAANTSYPLAYLVEEGGECSWEEKATVVEKLGGQYLILYSNDNSEGFPTDHAWRPYGWGTKSTYNGSVGALLISGEAGATIRQEQLDLELGLAALQQSASNGTAQLGLNNSVPARLAARLSENYENAFGLPYNALPTVITMKVTGGLSFLGSTYIAINLVRKRRENVQARNPTLFLLLLSIGDMISSACVFIGTWAIPAVPAQFGQLSTWAWHTYYPWASGTQQTCTAQGFLFHFGAIMAAMTTAFIAIQNLLRIKYRWQYEQLHKLEIVGLTCSIFLASFTSISLAAMDLFNPLPYGWCWINEYPMICNTHESASDVFGRWCNGYSSQTNKNDDLFRFVFASLWLGLFTITICVCMVQIYCWVRKQENKAARWSATAQQGRAQKQVLWKAMCYLSAFLGANSIGTVAMFFGGQVMDVMLAFLYPLQGFLNVLVYSNILDWMLKKMGVCQPKRDENALPLGVRRPTEATASQASMERFLGLFVQSVRTYSRNGPPVGFRSSALRRACGDLPMEDPPSDPREGVRSSASEQVRDVQIMQEDPIPEGSEEWTNDGGLGKPAQQQECDVRIMGGPIKEDGGSESTD